MHFGAETGRMWLKDGVRRWQEIPATFWDLLTVERTRAVAAHGEIPPATCAGTSVYSRLCVVFSLVHHCLFRVVFVTYFFAGGSLEDHDMWRDDSRFSWLDPLSWLSWRYGRHRPSVLMHIILALSVVYPSCIRR